MSDVNALNLSYMTALAFSGALRRLRWECAHECVCGSNHESDKP